MAKFDDITVARFWAKVNRSGPTVPHIPGISNCWLWTGKPMNHGYGSMKAGGRTILAHRLSWVLTNGAIPEGLCVLHRCDVRLCIRPDHLWIGTKAQNNADMMAKGRQVARVGDSNGARVHRDKMARGERHGSKTKPERVARGARNGRARLTEDDVRQIRHRRAQREAAQLIGNDYGITDVHVLLIAKRKLWPFVV